MVNRSGTSAEAALIRVGGGMARMTVDNRCRSTSDNGGHVLACVDRSAVVHVRASMAALDDQAMARRFDTTWDATMMHEYAHVLQRKHYYRMLADPQYVRLFAHIPTPSGYEDVDFPIEASAECMTEVRMPDYRPSYPVDCTPEMLSVARRIWDGDFAEPELP